MPLTLLLSFFVGAAHAATPIALKASDGVAIHAVASEIKGSTNGVVLAHMLGRDSADWASMTKRLQTTKMSTVAVDFRGHGKSANTDAAMEPADYAAMLEDLKAATAWLRERGVTNVSCVGASLGANLCAQLGAADPGIVNLVLLSPGLNYKGVTSGGALKTYGDRPVLIVAAEDDRFGPRNAEALEGMAQGQVHYELLPEGGHGTKMLTRASNLEPMVMSWLAGTFQLMSGDLVRPQAEVKTKTSAIETSGKKMQVHQ
jgi:pimeloyl-ACP methyl ester carboxylesterase